jgi:hypothetical protein
MLSQPSPVSAATADAGRATDRLNAVPLSGAQVAAALEVLSLLPAAHRDDPRSQATVLQAYARDAGFADDATAGAALHARVTSLKKWTAANDPLRQSNAEAVMEAAALHPLVEIDGGIGFEAPAFQEMILFIEELPW